MAGATPNGLCPLAVLRLTITLGGSQIPAPKTPLDNLFPLAKILHRFLAIRLGDYFGRNKFTSFKRNLVFLATFKISHFFE